ncbi:hypothetical protein ACHHYP_15132 [Achlya hypogyna]|uniref:Mediator of RNA polymerase II transcription subunit 13 n=1 Tax=Achlya hypogyna TaxID=1202772 RepID=A0A1V9ZF23_ACHHY|nr:hypothetical protein ACHHYP_15132 [Achlya hypogyna]
MLLAETTSVRPAEMQSNAWSLGKITRLEFRVFGPAFDRSLFDRMMVWATTTHRRPLLVATEVDCIWSFTVSVQGTPHIVPGEFDALEMRTGAWSPSDDLDDDVMRMFTTAVECQVRAWLLHHSRVSWSGEPDAAGDPAFRAEGDYLVPNEPTFTMRSLSSNREATWETTVDADVPTTAFVVRAALVADEVWVHMLVYRKSLLAGARGLEYPHALWKRLQALPCEGFAAPVVDVWTMRDVSVAGILSPAPSSTDKDRPRGPKRPRAANASSEPGSAATPERPLPFSPDTLKRKVPSPATTSPPPTTDDEALTPISPDLGATPERLVVDFALGADTPLRVSRRVHALAPLMPKKSKKKPKKAHPWRVLQRVPRHVPRAVTTDDSEAGSTADEADVAVPLPTRAQIRPADPALASLAAAVADELRANADLGPVAVHRAPLLTAAAFASLPAPPEPRYLPRGTLPRSRPGDAGPSTRKAAVVPLPPAPTPAPTNEPAAATSERLLGLRLLATAALVGWQSGGWQTALPLGVSPCDRGQRQRFLASLRPHVDAFASRLLGTPAAWLGPEAVCGAGCSRLPVRIPALTVAKAEAVLTLPPHVLPEWPLRGFQPLGPMKNVDYVALCPDAPWLVTLATGYLAAVRTAFMNLSLGDHEPLELGARWGVSSDTIGADLEGALLLLRKSPEPFATYRDAARQLAPILADGPAAQPFARTALATVVYVVAPFGPDEAALAARLLGAVAAGLSGGGLVPRSVVLEPVYLPDLLALARPHAFAARAFALYDKIYEKVPLQYDASSTGLKPPTAFVNEQLFALAETPDVCCDVLLAYTVRRRQLLWSLVDATGALMDVDIAPMDDDHVSDADIALLLEKSLAFYVLGREKGCGTIAVTHVGGPLSAADADAWGRVWHAQLAGGLAKYASVVRRCVVGSLVRAPLLQWHCDGAQTALVAGAAQGLLVVSPQDVSPGDCRVGRDAPLLEEALATAERDDAVFMVSIDATLTTAAAADDAEDGETDGVLGPLLRQLQEHTWLSIDPVSGRKQSPYPRHAGAVEYLAALVDRCVM